MGRKRKQRTEDEIRRKIRKLEDRLADCREHAECSRSEERLNYATIDTPYSGSPYGESPVDTVQYDEVPSYLCSPRSPASGPHSPRATLPDDSPQSPSRARDVSPQPAISSPPPPPPTQPPPPPPPQPGTSSDKAEEMELEDDILQLLGDAPKSDTPLGPPIYRDVAQRWQDILARGLSKEVKESLLKDYSIPSNCEFLLAPTLNLEVKAALPEALVKRDSSLMHKQKQLGIALSALATVTEMVIANETSKQKILKPLSDACRILCDSHFVETRTRRGFVISTINAKLKDTLIESTRDKLLFGENVSDKLKAAKSIQQSGEALKNDQKPRFQRPNNNTGGKKNHLNYAAQHRKTDNKSTNSRRATNYSQRNQQGSSSRRPADHDRDRDRPSAKPSAYPRR